MLKICVKIINNDSSNIMFPLFGRSTQAYLINKEVVRKFIDKVVSYNSTTETYSIKIVNPSEKQFPCAGRGMCEMPFRLVADLYIFTGCEPTYLSHIPLFNGASAVGQNTTIHHRKNNDVQHAKAFDKISLILDDVRRHAELLPSFIRAKKCP